MTALNAIDRARVQNGARDLEHLAVAYGVSLPDEHREALYIAAEARRVAAAPPPTIKLPANAEKTPDVIRRTAQQRILARESAAVAIEFAEAAELQAVRVARASVPRIFAALSSAFDSARDDFARLVETAPLELTGDDGPERAGEHIELLRAAKQLTAAAANRSRLADIMGEEVKGRGVLWLILDPKPEINLSEIRSALTAEDLPYDLAGWLRFVHLGCSLAHDGEAAGRALRFQQATYHAGLRTPDGGMADRSYGDALALVPTPGAGQ